MQNSMTYHLAVTALLVSLIYGAVVWMNQDLFSEQEALWQEYSQTTEPDTRQNSSDAPSTSNNQPEQNNHAYAANSAVLTQAASLKPGNTTATDNFPAIALTGVSNNISLSNPTLMQQQIASTWQGFGQHAALQESVSWLKGRNTAYVYFHSFNRDFSAAKVLIGYATSAAAADLTSVNTRAGTYKRYEFNASGITPDAAWQSAYPNGVILERYTVDINGATTNQDITVIF